MPDHQEPQLISPNKTIPLTPPDDDAGLAGPTITPTDTVEPQPKEDASSGFAPSESIVITPHVEQLPISQPVGKLAGRPSGQPEITDDSLVIPPPAHPIDALSTDAAIPAETASSIDGPASINEIAAAPPPPSPEEPPVSTIASETPVAPSPSATIPPPGPERHTALRTALWIFIPIAAILLTIFVLSALHPELVSVLVRAVVTLVIIIFAGFLLIGIFVIVGLKDEARRFLSAVFEGGVRYLTLVQAVSELWDLTIKMIQELILTVSPVLAIFLSAVFYYVIMYVFRAVGNQSDVTALTIVMTFVLGSLTALLGMTGIGKKSNSDSFAARLSYRFGRYFVDGVEIAVLLIFLTIDSGHLFFLPESLQKPITAVIGDYDLMARGITSAGFSTTLRIAGFAVVVEIIRKIYRLVASIMTRYGQLKRIASENGTLKNSQTETFELLKNASQLGFKDNLDDFVKFIGFTSVLIFVFFLFPRLKLLSLLVFNLTNLLWDIMYPSRTTQKSRSEDLLSRTTVRVLKL